MIPGRIWPNENAARAHINAEAADWVPAPCVYQGSGLPVPAQDLPVRTLAAPIELEDGRWFAPEVPEAVFTNDNAGRRNGRRQDTITNGDVRRTYPDPHGAQAPGRADPKAPPESGIVARPGAQKAKAG
jgi:hypothetical protein